MKIENADTVLVRGAASGVGVAFAKLLKGKYPKARLYGSTRDARKADRLKAAGFDDVVVEKEGRLDTALSFDKIADLVGPSAMADSLAHLKDGVDPRRFRRHYGIGEGQVHYGLLFWTRR